MSAQIGSKYSAEITLTKRAARQEAARRTPGTCCRKKVHSQALTGVTGKGKRELADELK